MKDHRAGRAMLRAMIETLHLTNSPMCAKCIARVQHRRLLEKLDELYELLKVPHVFRGHDMNSAGYHLSQLREAIKR